MKTTGFEAILAGVSKISDLKFEIWNETGSIVTTDPDAPDQVKKVLPLMVERIYAAENFLCDETQKPIAVFGLPLFDGETLAGVLLAYRYTDRASDAPPPFALEDAKALLTQIADLVQERWDLQNESKTLITELDQNYESLHLYSTMATQIKTLNFSSQMLLELLKEIKDNIRIDMAFSLMPDRPNFSEIICRQEINISDEHTFSKALIAAIDLDNKSLDEGYFIVNDSSDLHPFSLLHPDPFRFLAVKISHAETFYGWLGIFSFNMTRIIKRSELRLLISIAEQIGMVISNTDLYHDLEDFGINIVKSLIATIEAKDVYTGGHSERVYFLSMLMAEASGMSEAERKTLSWSALLHDVGKIGIPEAILNKPDRLDDAEYDIIKGHPQKGVDILQPLEYLAASIPGILHHHEAYNGKGYPSGIKGEDIPLISRIISVADTFDAITSDRAYRKGGSFEKGLEIINAVSGTQLDPKQVQVFNKIYDTAKTLLKTRQRA